MPDNARTMKYSFKTEFDPRGVQQAVKGVNDMSGAFDALGSQVKRTNFGRALENMQQFHGVLPGIAERGALAAKGVADLAKSAAHLKNEMLKVESGVSLLQEQFRRGIVDKQTFKEGMDSYRLLRGELKGLTAETYQNRQIQREMLEQTGKLAGASAEELRKLGIPLRHFQSAISGSTVDVAKLHANIRKWGRDPAPKEVQRYAELYNNTLRHQSLLQEQAQQTSDKLNTSMGMAGAARGVASNLRNSIVQPFEEAYKWATRIPTRLSEGIKDGVSGAFSDQGFVSKTMGKLFNKGTIMKTLAFGPLGLLSGLTKKAPKDKDRPGFSSGGGGGLEGLTKSLGGLGGMLKNILGPFKIISYLFNKVLAPVIQTLTWALEPLIAPLQQLLTKAVMGFVPFIADIAALFTEMTKELLPPFMEIVESLGPVFVKIAKISLPPLVKMLKMTAEWMEKITIPAIEKLLPVLSWVADKISWLAEAVVGSLNWLGNALLDLPVIGWAMKKLGLSSASFTPSQQGVEGKSGSQPGTEPKPGMAAGGDYLPSRAMTVTEAGGADAFREFTQPRGIAEPINYKMPEGQMQSGLDRKLEAMKLAGGDRPDIVNQQDPDKMSKPVVAAIKDMTRSLLTILPKRIGNETKNVSLADFSAVTA